MNEPLFVIETASDENWNVDGYLMANPDVAAHVAAGGDPVHHFRNHGLAEGRRIITRKFLESRERRGAEKFQRFKSHLEPSKAAPGFAFSTVQDAFPIAIGAHANNLEDYAAESANPGFGGFIDEVQSHPENTYLDIGSGLRTAVFPNCLYLEVYPSLTADIVMEPACLYPLASSAFDGVSCLAVLEHVEEPWTVVSEIRRMLKPGGLAFIDWPFLQPVHGFPSHFYNATRAGLEEMFRDGFEVVSIDTYQNQTPDHALSWILREWSSALTSEAVRSEFLSMTVSDLISQPAGDGLWTRLLGATPEKTKMVLACGNTLVARKT